MLDTIINAVHNKQVISFNYDGYTRKVEPHAVGVSLADNDVLRCYQTAGGHNDPDHDWNMMRLDKITDLSVTGENFSSPRDGYKRGDKGMKVIYAEL